jgi:hypothetical protein
MPQLQSLEVQMSSGSAGAAFTTIQRVQNVSVGANLERTTTKVLGRFKPLTERPINNFVPIQYNVSFVKVTREVEDALGFINTTGVGMVYGGNGNTIDGYGCRNLSFLVSPLQTNNYVGQINVYSGCVSSYRVSASVGEPAQASFGGEGLEWTNTLNNGGRSTTQLTNYSLITPENVSISGIDVSGFGISGITAQSFELNLSIARQSAFRLGQRLPVNRVVTDINASLSFRGFFEGIEVFTGFGQFNCGQPYTGTMYFTLSPGCGSYTGTTYAIRNPYLDSLQIGAQVGNFTTVDMQFSVPISINSGEAATGSNLVIL